MESAWEFTDAWLLTAAAQFGRRGCSLSELIGAADALNHDIPTVDQARRSLGRLRESGPLALAVDGERIAATAAAREIYRRRSRPMFEQAKSVLRLLERVPLAEGDWVFEPGEFQSAYEEYRTRMGP